MKSAEIIKVTVILTFVMLTGILNGQTFNGGSGDGFDTKMSDATDFSDIAFVSNYNTPIKKVNAFPNPSDGIISIKIDEQGKTGFDISVFNITGNRIELSEQNKQTEGDMVRIDLSDKPAGIYLIRFVSDKNIYLSKINIY